MNNKIEKAKKAMIKEMSKFPVDVRIKSLKIYRKVALELIKMYQAELEIFGESK